MASLPFKTSNNTENPNHHPLALPSFSLQPRIPRQEASTTTDSIPTSSEEKPPSKEAIHIGPKRLCFESAMNDMADELHSTMTLSSTTSATSASSSAEVKRSASSSSAARTEDKQLPVLQLPLEGSASSETTLQNPNDSSEKSADHHKFNRSSTPSTAASTKSSSSMESSPEESSPPALAVSTLPSISHRTMTMTSEADILAVMRGEAPATSQQQHPATTATHPHSNLNQHPACFQNKSAAPPPMLHQRQPPQQAPAFGTVLAPDPQGKAAGSAFTTAPPEHAVYRMMLNPQPQPHSLAWNHYHHSYNANHKRSRTSSVHAPAVFAQPRSQPGSSALLPKQSHKRLKVGPIPQQERKQSNLDLLCSVAASIDPSPAQASAPVPSVSTKQTPNLNKLKMKQTKKKSKDTSKQSCKCIKRHCLSLYCACFRVGVACGMDCQCCPGDGEDVKCHNVQDDERREQVSALKLSMYVVIATENERIESIYLSHAFLLSYIHTFYSYRQERPCSKLIPEPLIHPYPSNNERKCNEPAIPPTGMTLTMMPGNTNKGVLAKRRRV